MWLYLSGAFLSVVAYKNQPDNLLVRARLPEDINRVFPYATVTTSDDSDYKFRAALPREQVADAIHASIMGINYTNFKDTVEHGQRSDAYFDVWARMQDLQEEYRAP